MTVTPIEKTNISSGIRKITAIEGNAVFRCSYNQEEEESSWSMIKNIRAEWSLKNIISIESCEIDILETDVLIEDGDRLIIKKNDGSIVKMTAQGVSGTGPYFMDTSIATGGESPLNVYKDNCVIKFEGVPLQEAFIDTITEDWIAITENPFFYKNIDGWEDDTGVVTSVSWRPSGDAGEILYIGKMDIRYQNIPIKKGHTYRMRVRRTLNYDGPHLLVKKENGDVIYEASFTQNPGPSESIFEFVADTDSIYYEIHLNANFQAFKAISIEEKAICVSRQYLDHVVYPVSRNIELTVEIPEKGSELSLVTSLMYKTGL